MKLRKAPKKMMPNMEKIDADEISAMRKDSMKQMKTARTMGIQKRRKR
jgi:hypothetical protein